MDGSLNSCGAWSVKTRTAAGVGSLCWGGVMGNETRIDGAAGAQLDLFGVSAAAPAGGPGALPNGGVGGRQGRRVAPRGGGGYLSGRAASELGQVADGAAATGSQMDVRFRELEEIGLSASWLAVARHLGFDRFIYLWRHLASDPAVLTSEGLVLMRLRDFAAYERVQRNQYIRRLAGMGLQPGEIHSMLQAHLGDHDTTYSAVKRIASNSWAESRLADYDARGMSSYLVERLRRTMQAPDKPDLFPGDLERAIVGVACKASPPVPRRRAGQQLDPRHAELVDIGLSASWLAVARIVGYDDFVALWRFWSADPSLRDRDGLIELRLRTYRAYERYQRNRYIETLVAAGLPPSQIQHLVRSELGENLSSRHINRLSAAHRVKP